MVDRVEITNEIVGEDAIPGASESVVVPTDGEAADTPARPEWLPEQFADPVELAKAYGELRSMMDGKKSEPSEEVAEAAPEGDADGLKLSPETLQQYSAKYNGEGLSEQDYADLDKMGVSRSLVGQFAAGQTALVDQQTASVYREVGGEGEYTAMITWAADNLNTQESEAFNQAILSNDQTSIMMATRGLHSQYTHATGKESNLIGGNTASSAAGSGFESTAQVVEAMNNPKYAKDSAYRNEVLRKMQNSNF